MICRKVFFLAGLTLCASVLCLGQTVTSARNGSWSDPQTWDNGIVPDFSNASVVQVHHDVSVESTVVAVHSLSITGTLTIAADADLTVRPRIDAWANVNVSGTLLIYGDLTSGDSVAFTTSPGNTTFSAGATFRFKGGPKAYIPIATWSAGSVLQISGFRNSGYVALAFADGWRQHFANVVYDCPDQNTFVDLNGHLRYISGNLIVSNTNGQPLRLSTTQRPVIDVSGDFIIEGDSEVWFNTTGDSTSVLIGGRFVYQSTSNGPSYLATRGRTFMKVGAGVFVDAAGPLRLFSGSVDSTGIRKTTLDISGGLDIKRGTLIAPAPGQGTLRFSGIAEQQVSVSSGAFVGQIDFYFSEGTTTDLGGSVLSGSGGIVVEGYLKLGAVSSFDSFAANIACEGEHQFLSGSTVEYNGMAMQAIGETHPRSPYVNLVLNNEEGVLLNTAVEVRRLASNCSITSGGNDITVHGNIELHNVRFEDKSSIVLVGEQSQSVSFDSAHIHEIRINKPFQTEVFLTSPVWVDGRVAIENDGNILHSDGHLTLESSSTSSAGSASVVALPDRARIEGDVVVQRFIEPGRMYRYISSPVAGATVSQLMDDFPVTGIFEDPSTGRGLNSRAPSLYYYDESAFSQSWVPYPTTGAAAANTLESGRGYSAFIREERSPVIWDVSGTLNQGEIEIPVTYTAGAPPEFRGWNLVGNPYPSSISWSRIQGWRKSPDLSEAFAVRDNESGRFRYFDGQVGDIPSGVIAMGQAFWVRTTATSPFLFINESAKSSEGADFYRTDEASEEVSMARLSIAGSSGEDCVYIRKRSGADARTDRFDAVKMKNQGLNFSILSPDSIELAIWANENFDCLERFQLVIRFPSKASGEIDPSAYGAHTITLNTSGLFSLSGFRLEDRFIGETFNLDEYMFEVTDDPRSYDVYRFVLVISTPSSRPSPAMPDSVLLCGNEALSYFIEGASPFFNFYAHAGNQTFRSTRIDSSVVKLEIPANSFIYSTPSIMELWMKNICTSGFIDSVIVNRRPAPLPPLVLDAIHCFDGEIAVTMGEPRPRQFYRFFNAVDAVESFLETSSTEIRIGGLNLSSLYVDAASLDGCKSEKIIVPWREVKREPPIISLEDGVLRASWGEWYWYFNSSPISAIPSAEVTLERDGIYAFKGTYKGCKVQAFYHYSDENEILIGPIPFYSEISINTSPGSREVVNRIMVFDMQGRIVLARAIGHNRTISLKTEDWKAGVYYLKVESPEKDYLTRILKL